MRTWTRKASLLAVSLLVENSCAENSVPSVDTYLRRLGSRGIVVGDFAYFDGGQVSVDGVTSEGGVALIVNKTISIDLSSSWSPDNVTLQTIDVPDSKRSMNNQAIFGDESSFYIWGGSAGSTEPPSRLWKFEPDGQGEGTWFREQAAESFGNHSILKFGADVSTPDAAFVVGGIVSYPDESEEDANAKGVLSFDFSSGDWTRDSDGPFSRDGSIMSGTATWVPSLGPNGIVLLLGGVSRYAMDGQGYVGMNEVHFFDPVTKEWYRQATTGDQPVRRHRHCAVGVSSDTGTFEIFVYGGGNRELDRDFSDVHVLSLPGFRWTKVSDGDEASQRRGQDCMVVGNRQLLSWGGITTQNNGDREEWLEKDPFPQGIGIFDMSDLEWKDGYDAEAAEYQTHESIKSWYDDGGLESIEWSSPEVQELFRADISDDQNENGSDGSGDGDGDGDGEGDGQSENSSSTPTAAIVGGVVGGVGGVAVIAAGAWFFLRRRRRRQRGGQINHPSPSHSDSKASTSRANTPKEPSYQAIPELGSPDVSDAVEMENNYVQSGGNLGQSRAVFEMEGSVQHR